MKTKFYNEVTKFLDARRNNLIPSREEINSKEDELFTELSVLLNKELGCEDERPLKVWGTLSSQTSIFIVSEFNNQGRRYGSLKDTKYLEDLTELAEFYESVYIKNEEPKTREMWAKPDDY